MTEARRYERNPAGTETEIDGEIFLVEPDTQEVFYLDTFGAALWRLLAEPQAPEEIVAVYRAAFPATDGKTIRGDVEAALRDLLDRSLILARP